MTKFHGTVIYKTLNNGSKSERRGACLRTKDGTELTLLRRGEDPFADLLLETLSDKEVICEGEVREGYLFITTILENYSGEQ